MGLDLYAFFGEGNLQVMLETKIDLNFYDVKGWISLPVTSIIPPFNCQEPLGVNQLTRSAQRQQRNVLGTC